MIQTNSTFERPGRARRLGLGLGLCISLTACIAEDDEPSADLRSVVFDGEEVAQTIAADPDAVFMVDLREPSTYLFDQRARAIDFDRFLVQCPSMLAPVPMDAFAEMLDLSTAPTLWSLAPVGVGLDDDGFRDNEDPYEPEQDPLGCGTQCDANGFDCVIVCNNGG